MQDADGNLRAEHPLRQPQHNGRHVYDDALEPAEPDAYQHQSQAYPSQLPQHRGRNALVIGVVAGILCSLQGIAIAVANSAKYRQASQYAANKIPLDLANAIGEIAVLTFFIVVVICLVAGFIAGKVTIQRRFGFFAGFVAGLVTYGISLLLNYIPNYPGRITGSAGASNAGLVLGGFVVVLILFIIWGLIAGLISLCGAWLATRKHPYYRASRDYR